MGLLLLNRNDFPNIDPTEVGSPGNEGYGVVNDVRVHAIVAGAVSRLSAPMTRDATSLTVDDDAGWPAAPFTAQIAGEIITVGARNGKTFSSLTRAAANAEDYPAEPHAIGSAVYEVKTEYIYLVSPRPVHEITGVRIDGVRQSEGFTAYTGQTGDEHGDYPGRAVISFPVDLMVVKQRNVDPAQASVAYRAIPVYCTDDGEGAWIGRLRSESGALGFSIAYAPPGYNQFWVVWPERTTTLQQDSVIIDMEETAGTTSKVLFGVIDIATGQTIRVEEIPISANARLSARIGLTGVAGIKLTMTCAAGAVTIAAVNRTSFRRIPPPDEPKTLIEDYPETWTNRGVSSGSAQVCTFSTNHTGTVCYISPVVEFADGVGPGVCDVILAGWNDVEIGRQRRDVPSDVEPSMYYSGGFSTKVRVEKVSGDYFIDSIRRRIAVLEPTSNPGAAGTSAKIVIGERVTVDASWHFDGGGVITAPEKVIEHFLLNYLGAAAGEIDATSFAAAGTLYAAAIAGGYQFEGLVPKEAAWTTLMRMAFDCRSTVRFVGGAYYLNYTPDAAPAALPDDPPSLTTDDLAVIGSQFTFKKQSTRTIFNSLTALYAPNFSGDYSSDISSGYLASVAASDSTSIAKYGEYRKDYQLRWVRDQVMAEHVLAHHLLERKLPLLTVTGLLFWRHSGLKVGVTLGITNAIYSGRKWWVSGLLWRDKYTLELTATEWWG